MTSLETERLLLREFEDSDWEAVHEYGSDLEVVKYLLWGPNTEEESRNFIRGAIDYQQQEPRKNYVFAVVLKVEDLLIGGCGIHMSTTESPEGWLGYCYNRHFWGKGYATEVARALLAFGFKELGLHRIFATCDVENVASARVLEKIGMRREGHLREHKWARRRWRDSFLYAILDHEWQRLKAGSIG